MKYKYIALLLGFGLNFYQPSYGQDYLGVNLGGMQATGYGITHYMKVSPALDIELVRQYDRRLIRFGAYMHTLLPYAEEVPIYRWTKNQFQQYETGIYKSLAFRKITLDVGLDYSIIEKERFSWYLGGSIGAGIVHIHNRTEYSSGEDHDINLVSFCLPMTAKTGIMYSLSESWNMVAEYSSALVPSDQWEVYYAHSFKLGVRHYIKLG